MKWPYIIGAALIVVVMLPALLAGAGFVVAILLALAIAAIFFGGPTAYDVYKTKNLGANSKMNARDMLAGNGDGEMTDISEEDKP